jgi:hypothetical protein
MRLRDRFRLVVTWDPMPEFHACPACQGRCYMRSVTDGTGHQYLIPVWPGNRHKACFPCHACKGKGSVPTIGSDNRILEKKGF